MSAETEIWCRNIESGAVLKLAQSYHKQGQLIEALALCIKAAHLECDPYSEYHSLLYFATAPLQEALGDEQFCQIVRGALDYSVSKEFLDLMVDNLQQTKTITAFYGAGFNPWTDAAVHSLPNPTSEYLQLSQTFLQSVRHKLATSFASSPPTSKADAYYQEAFRHLHLPTGYTYSIPKPSLLIRALEAEGIEESEALGERNYYAFYRYLKTLGSNSEPVYTVVFSPNGQTIASGSSDRTIRLWDSETKQPIHTLTGHSDSVLCIAFNPNGKILASSSADTTVKLWDVSTGQELRSLTGHSDSVFSLAFSPDGHSLASGGADAVIKLWDMQTWQELGTLTNHSNSVLSVAFSPDGQTLASGGADAAIKLWDVKIWQECCTLTQNFDCVYSLCFHPQDQVLVSAHRGQSINIWNLSTCEVSYTISPFAEVVSIAVSSDGQAIAGGGGCGIIWNFNTGKVITTLHGYADFIAHRDIIYAIAFSPDRSMLVSTGKDGTVKLWGIPKPLVF